MSHRICIVSCAAVLVSCVEAHAGGFYTVTNIGIPPNAGITIGVRMNNLGQVAGYSIYYSQGEPSMKPWIWSEEDGFTILPPPPNMFLGRARALDISDTGIVAGDGGFDSGVAWRYENGEYETFGQVGGMPIAYLGAVNDLGDVTGTAKDSQFSTIDEMFFDINGGESVFLTPGLEGGRASDVNNAQQICGLLFGAGPGAFRWDAESGFLSLGSLDLTSSTANAINEAGDVVGSANQGNTSKAWIYTDSLGQRQIPAPVTESTGPAAINRYGHVVGTSHGSPDFAWLWTGGSDIVGLNTLFDFSANTISLNSSRDINDSGQILAGGYDNSVGGWRNVILSPPQIGIGACCLAEGGCMVDLSEQDCTAQSGQHQGSATDCAVCIPTGACCFSDGGCTDFRSLVECDELVGTWQGADSGCAMISCPVGVANDDCANAIGLALGDTSFSTLGSSTDGPGLPQSCAEPAGTYFGMDIWYTFEPEGDGILTVSTCNQADYDTRLAAYTGTCGNLQIAGCNDDIWPPECYFGTSIMDVDVTCGEPVLIRVGSFSVYTGSGTLSVSFTGDGCSEACPQDTNHDNRVSVDDLIYVILAWHTPDPTADVNSSGMVDVDDLVSVIVNWGQCP